MNRQFISFPKSGRTWIRYILVQLGLEPHIHFHHDDFEFNDGAMPKHNFDLESRLIKYRKVDKIVYLERDPGDVIVSLYYQVTGRFNDFFDFEGDISEFIRHEYFGAQIVHKFQFMWRELSKLENVLIVRYEDCHKDMFAVIKLILHFYGFAINEKDIKKAVKNSSIDKMKQVEKNKEFLRPWMRPRNGAYKVRRGKIGGFTDELNGDDISYLNLVFNNLSGHEIRKTESTKRLLVAWFTFSLNGGIGRFIHCARVLEKRGYAVNFLTLDNTFETKWPYLQGKIISFDQAIKFEWDAVMIPGAGISDEQIPLFELLNNPKFGIKVQHVLNDPTKAQRFLAVNKALKPKIVIFNNSHWKNCFGDLEADIFHILPGAVDTNIHYPKKRSPSAKNNALNIGGYGRKNPAPLIEAVLALPEKYVLHLYGLTKLNSAQAQELEKQKRLKFWGNIFDEELADFYNEMDVVVTTELFAGWCNSAAQAMAHGVPVISSIAGTIDFADNKKNILILDEVTGAQIKNKIEYLTANPVLAKEISKNAYEKMSFFSWEDYCTKLIKLIENASNEIVIEKGQSA